MIRKSAIALVVLAGCAVLAGLIGTKLPTGFLPEEDLGYLMLSVQLPDAASLQRTDETMRKIEEIVKQVPAIEVFTSVVGVNVLSRVQDTYSGFFFIKLKPWDQRRAKSDVANELSAMLTRKLSALPDGISFSITPPAIPGIGTSGGFTFILEDRAGRDLQFLEDNLATFLQAARKRPELANVTTTFLPRVPQVYADVDRDKTVAQGVAPSDVYLTLQTFMGGSFINYFNRFGRQWRVFLEAEGGERTRAEDVNQFYVRNARGDMVPLSALTTLKRIVGPEFTQRYNLYRCAQIFGNAAPGYSSGQAMRALEEVHAQTMPREMGFDYAGMSYQEWAAQRGLSVMVIFGMSLVFVFLILAALYESWTLPVSVLLGTPVAVAGRAGDAGRPPDDQRRLRPDRAGHADRAGGQERHPDRRVCARALRGRHGAGRGRAGRGQAAVAAHPDDVVRLHSGLRAAVDGDRRGRGRAAGGGQLRHRRHGRRHRHCHPADPRHLLFNGTAGRETGRGAGRGGARVVNMRSIPVAMALGAACLLGGCVVGPKYKAPTANAPPAFRGQEGAAQAASIADLPWWEIFKDPTLQDLVKTAIGNNYDLRIAVRRLEQARELTVQARSQYYPGAGYEGGVSGGKNEALGTPTYSNGKTAAALELGLGASWELDLWGRIRHMNEAALAGYLSTEQARRGVILSLVTGVAQAYYELLELDLRLEIARRTVETFRGSLKIFQERLEGGTASRLETARAQAALASTAAEIPEIERQIALKENEIRILLGSNPGPVVRSAKLLEQALPPEVPAGLPSALLERRPDVLQAEQAVRAANAQVGIAAGGVLPHSRPDHGARTDQLAAGEFPRREHQRLVPGREHAWAAVRGRFSPFRQSGRRSRPGSRPGCNTSRRQ